MTTQKRYPSDEAAKFMLRLPTGMRERIAAAAKAGHRSMNSEIVLRIQASLDQVPVAAEPIRSHLLQVREEAGVLDATDGDVRRLVESYLRLPVRKQRALLELLDMGSE